MKNKQINQMLQNMVENDIPKESINLWTGIEHSIYTRTDSNAVTDDNGIKRSSRPSRAFNWAAASCLAVLALSFFFAATPRGQVLAQELIHFFTRADDNERIVPQVKANFQTQVEDLVSAPPVTDTVEEEGCGSIMAPQCSLDEVQNLMPFEVSAFASPPAGMVLTGGTVTDAGVILNYSGDKGTLLVIETASDPANAATWTIGRDAALQSTNIQQHPAEYVQGTWSGLGISEHTLTWDESMPGRTLRWQVGDIEFTLLNFPARGENGPAGYDLDQLVSLAENLVASGTGISNSAESQLTIEDAELQAGFEFFRSDRIPSGLFSYRATYDSQHRSICQYFRGFGDDPSNPALVIAQSTWALPTLDQLQTKVNFNGQPVTIGLAQEYLPINGADGGQGTFIESGIQIDSFCGGSPSTTNRVLLWQSGVRTFALFARLDSHNGTSFVTRNELQNLAESLNKEEPGEKGNSLDSERLLSLREAESLAGFAILQPSKMLTDVHFSHIAYEASMGNPLRAVSIYRGSPSPYGGTYRLLVSQEINPQTSLEELRLAGGFKDTLVKRNPAIYQGYCSETTPLGPYCYQNLSWFEGEMLLTMETFFPASIPEETLLIIAESMQ